MNKVMLIGNVGKDPEVRYVDNGVCTAKVSLATSTPGYTLPNGTQVPERAEWHNLLFWRRLAEVVEKYVRKGDKLYVEGELRTRNYTDRQGVTRYVTEVWVSSMEMLSPRPQQNRNCPRPQVRAHRPQRSPKQRLFNRNSCPTYEP